jgi:hypothetical protein
MSSPSKSLRDDFGQRIRTNFELSESGEYKQILDEVQYQIDCIKSQNVNDHTKKSALVALVRLFSSSMNRGIRQSFVAKMNEIVVILSSLLAKRSSWTMEMYLVGMELLLVLSADSDGSLDPALPLPKRLLSSMFQDFNPQGTAAVCECSGYFEPPKSTEVPVTTAESNTTGYHRKRKFKNQPERSEPAGSHSATGVGSIQASCGGKDLSTDFLSAVAGTFWCPTCARRSHTTPGVDVRQHSTVMQLLILNRVLAAKVATLSSVHTEFFQSANSAIQEEPNTKASSKDPSLLSPEDPTCRSSKSFYQRQAEALSQLQSALLDDTEDCAGDGQFTSYLEHLCQRIRQDIQRTPSVLPHVSVDLAPNAAHTRSALFGRMWLMLGILDTSCFRCPTNQV